MKLIYFFILSLILLSISCNRTKTKTDPEYEYQIVTQINGQQFAYSLGEKLVAPKRDFSENLSEFIFKELQESGEQKILIHMNLHESTSGKIQVGQAVFQKLNRWSFSLEKHDHGFRLSSLESETAVTWPAKNEMSVWIDQNIEKFIAKEAL